MRQLARALNHPALSGVGLAILCALVVVSLLQPISNPDIGWHLALGRSILETGLIPDSEIFTHTAFGQPMVAHEWLSQVFCYAVVSAVGVSGLRWCFAGVSVLVLCVLFGALRHSGVPPSLSLLGTLVYFAIAGGRFQVRPHMLQLLALVSLYSYLFVWKPKLRLAELAGVFIAVAIWANAHSGVLILPALVLLYACVETAQQRLGWRQPRPSDLGGGDLRRLWALFAVAIAGALATPHHFRLLPYLLESSRINSSLSIEWFAITRFWSQRAHLGASIELFWVLSLLMLLAAIATVGRVSSARLAVAAVLSALPLMGMRFLVAVFAPLLFVLSEFSAWLRRRQEAGRWGAESMRALSALAALGIFAWALVPVVGVPSDWSQFERNLSAKRAFRPDLFPVGAARFLDEVGLSARLYHPGRWGGYVLYRTHARIPIFSDGRWVTLGQEVVRDSAQIEARLPGSFELLAKYGVDLLLVPRGWMTPELLRSEGWLTLFENVNAGIYLRDSSETAGDLERVRDFYRANAVPFDPDMGFSERSALRAQPGWARRFGVQRLHLAQFRLPAFEVALSGGERVRGW